MATPQIPGQIEPISDERRLTNPIWYEWLLFLNRALLGSWNGKFVPVVQAGTAGPPTYTATSRYRQIGKTVEIQFWINITALNGSAAHMLISLPVMPTQYAMLVGRDIAVTGNSITCTVIPGVINAVAINYNGTTPFFVGAVVVISGTYEA